MQTATHSLTPNWSEIDFCRDRARQAAVTSAYRVIWDPDNPSLADETATSLGEATLMLLVSPDCTLRVDFEWCSGNQQGRDRVDYKLTDPNATPHFIERTLVHLVTKRIADSVHRGLLWECEYDGEIRVISEQ